MTQNFDPTEPEAMEIAMAFLNGFQAEMSNQNVIIQSLESEESRRTFASANPVIAGLYEGKTKEELEANKPYLAIAVGVAAAIKFALSKQTNTPTDV